jgi:hypothetical protein
VCQMTDLLLFVSLWAIFLLSYGVMLEALRLPGYDNSWDRLKRIVYYPYWQMYNVIDSDIQSGTHHRIVSLLLLKECT